MNAHRQRHTLDRVALVALMVASSCAVAQETPTPTCPKPVTHAYRFCSSGDPIVLTPTQATALTPIERYPVTIDARDTMGEIASLEVQFEGFQHTRIDRLRAVLQSPSGRAIVLRDGYALSPDGWNLPISGFGHGAPRMDFADIADRGSQGPTFPNAVLLGTRFIPTFAISGRSGTPAPAPAPPFAAFFDEFSGESPNGSWRVWLAHSGNRAIPGSGSINRVCITIGTHDTSAPCPALAETVFEGAVLQSDPGTSVSFPSGNPIGNCHPGDPDTGSLPGGIDGLPISMDITYQTQTWQLVNPFDIEVCAVIEPDYSGCGGSSPRLWVTRVPSEYGISGEYAFAKILSDLTDRAAYGVRLPPGLSATLRLGPGPGGNCPHFRYNVKLMPYGTKTDRVFRSNFG